MGEGPFESLSSSERDFWEGHLPSLFLDPVERVKPFGSTLNDLAFGKRDAMEVLAKNEEARERVIKRLLQAPPFLDLRFDPIPFFFLDFRLVP
jgi:hypothetical protein